MIKAVSASRDGSGSLLDGRMGRTWEGQAMAVREALSVHQKLNVLRSGQVDLGQGILELGRRLDTVEQLVKRLLDALEQVITPHASPAGGWSMN